MFKVSVITINYNDKVGLERTVKSVVSQTYKDFQYIIIDGGSNDGSAELLKEYSQSVDYCVSEKDNGVYDAMNKGIKQALGDYCIFINSGDSFYDTNVIGNFVKAVDNEDIISGICCEELKNGQNVWLPPVETDFCLRWFYRHTLCHQATFIKTALLKQSLYDVNYKIASDWKFFLDAIIIKKASYLPLNFYVCNYMDGGISRDENAAFNERDLIIKEFFGDRILRDCKTMQFGVNEWDALAKRVDPKSKVGKIIYKITDFFICLRSRLS